MNRNWRDERNKTSFKSIFCILEEEVKERRRRRRRERKKERMKKNGALCGLFWWDCALRAYRISLFRLICVMWVLRALLGAW